MAGKCRQKYNGYKSESHCFGFSGLMVFRKRRGKIPLLFQLKNHNLFRIPYIGKLRQQTGRQAYSI
jgi:hypothetical protein